MTKKDLFNLILAIIGLFANTIGIYTFFVQSQVHLDMNDSISNVGNILPIQYYILIYVWFIFSWTLFRYSFLKSKKTGNGQRKGLILTTCVFVVGLLLLPLIILINSRSESTPYLLFSMTIVPILIYNAIYYLVQIIYEDTVIFLKREGQYKCVNDFKSTYNKTSFKKSDLITVTNRDDDNMEIVPNFMLYIMSDSHAHDFNPNYYIYQFNNKKGKIHRKDLVANFKVIYPDET